MTIRAIHSASVWNRRAAAGLALLTCSLLLDCTTARAQDNRRVDLQANSVVSDATGGERVNRLSGDVRLRQDNTRIWATRAIEYTASDEILFTMVTMVESADTLTANSARYYKRNKTGRAQGNVRLSDGEVLVSGPSAFHNIERKYTRFERGVTLVDSLTTLKSERGEYWSDEKRALFTGTVLLEERGSVTRSDTVNFLREESIADASGNVSVRRVDSEDADSSFIWLFGQRAHNESRNRYSTVDGDALLVQVRPDSSSSDTTVIKADHLTSRETENVETMTGSGSVSIWREQLSAVADSVSFRKVKTDNGGGTHETVRLFGNPLMWFDNTQVRGDTIRVTIRNGELDSLFVDGEAFLAQEDSLVRRIQQVAGPAIRGALSGEQREIRIGPSADAIYFLAEDGELSGATRTHSDFVVMKFQGDSLKTITALKDIEGTFYAEEIIPDNLELPGFEWKPADRPNRELFSGDQRFRSLLLSATIEENK